MAKISELLSEGFSLSVELWPPRDEDARRRLEDSLLRLEVLRPTFASITYGAAGTTRDRTHDLVVEINARHRITPMAHLACAAHRRDDVVSILERYFDAGIENILALRGDRPLASSERLEDGECRYAIELVQLAKEVGDFCVAVAAHPEGHPDAPDLDTDRRHLAAKLEVADFAITQFFFRVEDYLSLTDDLDRLGNAKPVIPGIMPIANLKTVSRMAELSGTRVPDEVVSRVERFADDEKAQRRVGIEIAVELCQELLSAGVPGLHFYTMNRVATTLEICAALASELDSHEPSATRPI